MRFTNPVMLFAALAATIPIMIHLIHRHRSKPLRFSAVAFILNSHKAIKKNLRLRQFILLALRCLILIFLALALAKPIDRHNGNISASFHEPTAVVILVDGSMSMQTSMGNETAFDRAIQHARELVKNLSPDSKAAIILFDDQVHNLTNGLTADRFELNEALGQLRVGWRTTDIETALASARQLLSDSNESNRIAYLLTDLTSNGWESTRPAGANSDLTWKIVDVIGETNRGNYSIESLDAQEAQGQGTSIKVAIKSYADETRESISCEIFVDQTANGRGFIDLPPGGSETKRFTINRPKTGVHYIVANISDDILSADNNRYLILFKNSTLRVLIVDGDLTTVLRNAESFYLERALMPNRRLSGNITTTVIDPSGLKSTKLSDFDVMLLANTTAFSRKTAAAIQAFVKEGGGLLISLGDKVELTQLNSLLGPILPMKVRGWRQANAIKTATESKELHITAFPSEHPVLSVFDDRTLSVFSGVNFKKTAFLSPGNFQTNSLLLLNDGTPILVEASVEKGRVVLFGSSIDRAWNNFPIATVYLPLFRRVVRFLGGDLATGRVSDVTIGNRLRIPVGPSHKSVSIVGPTKTDVAEIPVVDGIAEFTPERPGFYRVLSKQGKIDTQLLKQTFSANVAPKEGDLHRISGERIASLFPSSKPDSLNLGTFSPSLEDSSTKPYWGLFLLFSLVLIGTEGILTRI